MTYAGWVDVLRQAFDLGCRSVQFTGGEPTLCPDLARLIRRARRTGYRLVEVYTNGTNLSQKVRDTLAKEGVDLAFSVYGSRAEVHDRVTGRPGSFAKTLASIRWALSAGLAVRTSIIEMPSNTADVAATRAMLRREGVRSIYVDGLRRIGRGSRDVSRKHHDPLQELCGHCWNGKLAIDSGGNAYPCIFSRFRKVGHVSQSLASILAGEKLYRFRKEVWQMSPTKKAAPKKKAKKRARKPCGPDKPKPKPKCAPYMPPCGPDVEKGCGPDIKKR